MLSELFVTLLRLPGLRKKIWRGWYQYLARSYQGADWTFMNYGFEDRQPTAFKLRTTDENDRYCIQLYHHLTKTVNFGGKRILEVGCGRGGGCSFIARYLQPEQMTGVDLSEEAIAFCTKTHQVSGLDFRIGDAEHLPFQDSAFDVVINVESSHCYPDLPAFFNEVHRVLKPGGNFLYADLHERRRLEEWRGTLRASGFTILHNQDITPQVLAALDRDNERKLTLINRLVPGLLRRSFHDFAGIRGAKIYEAFRSGSLMYGHFVAER